MAHSEEKIKSTDTALEKDSRAAILDKDLKTTILQMFKELKEYVKKKILSDA